ncbi:hypothetical protein [Rummeliibacillus suwonensis]|uniref:hypothetical protein n=1 Tax=Rummeliibacillus suwonensis TaxID=1306154 RepID=UPI0011B5D2F2|nr:hypothetical protein [Rummeliibacillus suwonensis]
MTTYLGCGTLQNGGCAEPKNKLLCVQKLDVDPVNSQYGKQNWKTVDFWGKSRYYSATYTDANNKWDKKQGGYGLRMNLPNNDSEYTEDVWELSSYMYYTAYKENSTKHIDAYGHYAHQEKDLIAVPSFSLSGSSFSISSSSSFTIHKPNTHAVYSW